MDEIISMGRRPTESETGPENVVIHVAPINDVATMSPSIVGSLCKLNSFLMYRTAPATDQIVFFSSIWVRQKNCHPYPYPSPCNIDLNHYKVLN